MALIPCSVPVSFPGCKFSEDGDYLTAMWSWMESSATPGTWKVFNKHFVFINFLTNCG